MKVEHNIARLKQLMEMYRLSSADLLAILNEKRKRKLTEKDLFSGSINVNIIKGIDKIFHKGIHYYIDPAPPIKRKRASVFFRKQQFGADLNLRAKQIVSKYERLHSYISATLKLADIEHRRMLPKYSLKSDPYAVAKAIRKDVYPQFRSNKREFLKLFIGKLAEKNVLVFEFIEHPGRQEKANIDGFYLKPNVIVLKRNKSLSREIFTLAHELGHLLLDREEIDQINYSDIADRQQNDVERWCNDFSYFFLAGEYSIVLDQLQDVGPENDYYNEEIDEINKKTHLSPFALYTRLLFQKQISYPIYAKVKANLEERFQLYEEKRRMELLKQMELTGQSPRAQKAIDSPLFIRAIQTAYFEGIMNEYEVSKRFDIKPEKVAQYIQ